MTTSDIALIRAREYYRTLIEREEANRRSGATSPVNVNVINNNNYSRTTTISPAIPLAQAREVTDRTRQQTRSNSTRSSGLSRHVPNLTANQNSRNTNASYNNNNNVTTNIHTGNNYIIVAPSNNSTANIGTNNTRFQHNLRR
jgi:hypothetical protein